MTGTSDDRFRIGAGQYRIVRPERLHEIRDEQAAERVTDACRESWGESRWRAWIHASTPLDEAADEGELRRAFVRLLLNGRLSVLEERDEPRLLDAPEAIPLSHLASDHGDEIETHTDWVGLVIRDVEGQGLAGERYILELADGREIHGETDEHGRARHDGVARGRCRIRFPDATGGDVADDAQADGLAARMGAGAEPDRNPAGPGSDSEAEELPAPSPLVLEPEGVSPYDDRWIVLELENEAGRMVRGAKFVAHLPDGGSISGTTADGRIELVDLAQPGDVTFEFEDQALLAACRRYPSGAAYLAIVGGSR